MHGTDALFEQHAVTDAVRTPTPREAPAAHRATVALVGNPNTGKTTLFNALTGFRRHVANYPGVTVDIARGPIQRTRTPMQLIDLPGTYSLAAVSPDEMVVGTALWGTDRAYPGPDVILAIADASNLTRNFYLISQLLELGKPIVIALNMVDIAAARGVRIDHEALSQKLGVSVVPVVATENRCAATLVEALEAALDRPPQAPRVALPNTLLDVARGLPGVDNTHAAIRILLDATGYAEEQYLKKGGDRIALERGRQRLQEAGINPGTEVRQRYLWVKEILEDVVQRPERPVVTWSDRIDRVLTHKVGGAVFLLAVLYVVFQSIFYWSGPLLLGIEWSFTRLGAIVGTWLPEGVLHSLVVDGIIGGVGGVIVFLPQIMILFLFIALLEDCGYMARAAFMVDRLMRTIGLSGRAFIPLLSGFACAVPAIMGTRTIADRRERAITVMLIPFMSCSARLPVYIIMIGALVPPASYLGGLVRVQALVMLAMYLVGIITAIPVAWMLRKTAFGGPPPAFMIELPTYKLPRLRTVWQRVSQAATSFLWRAGSVILVVNVIVWALAYFPRNNVASANAEHAAAAGTTASTQQTEVAQARLQLENSYLGRMGRAIEPAIEPLGWDWRIGVSVLASFPAREVIIATLGTLFNLSEEEEAHDQRLIEAIQTAKHPDGRPLFTLPVALSIMVFFALCAQCASTLVMVAREMGAWYWAGVSFLGMTTLAYFAAWGVRSAAAAIGL